MNIKHLDSTIAARRRAWFADITFASGSRHSMAMVRMEAAAGDVYPGPTLYFGDGTRFRQVEIHEVFEVSPDRIVVRLDWGRVEMVPITIAESNRRGHPLTDGGDFVPGDEFFEDLLAHRLEEGVF